jgi:acyl dehydratase
MSTPTIRFDDIDGLRAQIRDEYGEWGPEVTMSQDVIDRFADLTDDHQWIHVDTERAKTGPFGTTIAHGFLILAMLPRVRPSLGFDVVGESSRVNYGAESYRFLAPVPSGSTLHAKGRLIDVRTRPQGTLLVSELVIGVVGSERPAAIYTGLLLYKP